jgi:hypothetical protein
MNTPSNPDRNLDYQFYFLFRRTYCPQGEDKFPEPFPEFGTLQGIGIPIDTDKRLFRRNAPPQKPLAEWQTHLKEAWDSICQEYSNAFSLQPPQPQLASPQAVDYCEKTLLGIALVLWDDSLDRHEVKLDLYDNQHHLLGEVSFAYRPKVADTWFFSLRDKVGNMPQPAEFHALVPTRKNHAWKVENWSLRLDHRAPYLVTMLPQEKFNKPIFAVYGLAHGDADTALQQQQTWPTDLQQVLAGGGDIHQLRKTEVLNALVARLLIRDAVFEMMDCTARHLRGQLEETNAKYSRQDETMLKITPNSILAAQLREMENLLTQATYTLGYLKQGIETLEINYENLQWRLDHLQQELGEQWQLDYQGAEKLPPLLANIRKGIKDLSSHLVYIQGKLTYLEGSRNRWRSYAIEHDHAATEHLGYAAHIIIFLVALAELPKLIVEHHNTNELSVLYFTIIFILILSVGYVSWYYGKKVIKYLRYHFRQTVSKPPLPAQSGEHHYE